MKIKMFLLALLFIGIASVSQAQDKTPVVDNREQNQKERINEGRKSGELTRHEAHKLRREEHRVRKAERKAKADGVVTPEERAKLNRKLNKTSRDIHREKHD